MRLVLAVGVLVSACGDDLHPDGEPLAPAPNLTIVAHPDDDLLFLQPDVGDLAQRRAGLTSVYVTAGVPRGARDDAELRYAGVMAAYAAAAGLHDDWRCGWIELAGHPAEHCRLDDGQLSLVFLGYPDGGKRGEGEDSLLRLWRGERAGVETLGRRPARYDRDGLIAAVAEAVTRTAPATIRTLELAGTHGRDHADHRLVGALALAAAARAGHTGELLAFRGYAIDGEPANVVGPAYDRAYDMLARYHACAAGCARCGEACPVINEGHAAWAHRRYAVARRTGPLGGVLRLGARCADVAADGGLVLAGCERAPAWRLAPDGVLRVGDRCVTASTSGELATGACGATPTAADRFFLDDDGHLWSGQPPPAARVVAGAHAACVVAEGDRLITAPCGRERAPRWSLLAPAGATLPRPAWLASTGRAVRLGPLGLCAIEGGALTCADPATLATPVAHGALPVEPESLTFVTEGDRAHACGRTAAGLVCLAPGEAAALWSPMFAADGPPTAFDRSLAGFEREVCGLDEPGVTCTRRGLSVVPDVRSRWPAPDSTLWPGDLDGDGAIDWCVGAPDGARCARSADRPLDTAGIPWSYHLGGATPSPTPIDPALGALADVDGDGRADLCAVLDRRITCARSQGYGFGPPVVLAELAPGAPPRGLWLDGATACVDDAATLTCVALR